MIGPIGAIRPFHPLGASLRALPRLRLCLVGQSASDGRPWNGSPEIERVWLRRQPWMALRPLEIRHAWYSSPRVSVGISLAISSASPATAASAPRAASPLASPLVAASSLNPMFETTIARRTHEVLEMTVARHTHESLEMVLRHQELVRSIGPVAVAGGRSVPAATRASAAISAPPPPSHPMILPVPKRPAAVEAHLRPERQPDAGSPAVPARTPSRQDVRLPDHQIERITDQVIRTLDHRLIAWRERMGRR